MAVVWWLHLRSYRDANRAKSAVINKIETEYLTVHPFTDEWAHLRPEGQRLEPPLRRAWHR